MAQNDSQHHIPPPSSLIHFYMDVVLLHLSLSLVLIEIVHVPGIPKCDHHHKVTTGLHGDLDILLESFDGGCHSELVKNMYISMLCIANINFCGFLIITQLCGGSNLW